MSLPAYQSQDEVYKAGVAALAPYLDGNTLNSLSRVSRAFFEVFGAYLWADPIKTLSKSQNPYTKTIKFVFVKHDFSALVQTLDFRPLIQLKDNSQYISDYVLNERFFNCHYLLNVLNYFKYLKFVVLDGIQNSRDGFMNQKGCPRFRIFPLLLSVSSSALLDMSGVLEAEMFVNLMYLDISATYHGAEEMTSLNNYDFDNLRVLKMRNMRFTKLPRFILAIGHQLWSLDVCSNHLTDNDIEALISFSIKPAIPSPKSLPHPITDATFFVPPPQYTVHDNAHEEMPARRPDSASTFIESMIKTDDEVGNPMYAQTGLTQLYISNNKITAHGAKTLLETTNRLQVLDLGAILSDVNPSMLKTHHATIHHAHGPQLMPPSQLERIRIHHSFVTYIPTMTLGSSIQYHIGYIKEAETFAKSHTPDAVVSYDPLQNHRITHLILTDIPTRSYGLLIDALISLIRKATQQSLEIEYVRSSRVRHHRSPPLLPGLRLLRLEFIHDDGKGGPSSSVSGDKDAETFLERSVGDFSFFGEGERGVSSVKRVKGKAKEKDHVLRDVVAELREFREKESSRWPGQLQLAVPGRS